jgi:hypothetical protein
MKKTLAAIIIPLLVFSLTGCTSCKNRATAKKMKTIEAETVLPKIEKEISKNVYPLPTSVAVIKMLTDLEVGYIFGITNPAANVKKYYTQATRSINLGIYGADLSYVTLYKMNQEVNTCMDVIRNLANELNMSKIYNAALYDSIKKNFDNRDRLIDILTVAFNDTYSYMSENDQQALALLVVGGAWVEGMYLTTNVSDAAYNVATISKVLIEQKKSFDLFLDLTKPYMEDPLISDFVKNMEPIKKVYARLGTSLTDTNIKDIKEAIVLIRTKLIL